MQLIKLPRACARALTHVAARPGMGDVLSLVEKAEAAIKEDEAEALTARLLAAKFDFNDFLKQYKMVTGMGSMGSIMKMLPGARPRVRSCLAEARAMMGLRQ